MTPSSENNSFTAKDIERYHSGTMSATERNALEKAALEDPFLADALEGYAYTSTPSADLQNLQARLNERTRKKKSAPVVIFGNTWMRAAVVLFVVAGGGWLAYQGFKAEPETIAKSPVPLQKREVATPTSADSVEGATAFSTEPVPQEPKAKSETAKPTHNKNERIESNEQNRGLEATPGQLVLKDESKQIVSSDSARQRDTYATAQGNAAPATEKKDIAGYVTGKEALNKKAQAPPTANARTQASGVPDTVRNVDVVLQENPRPLTEVVVGQSRRKEAEAKGRLPRVIIDTLEPAEGYVQFDDYVANNLKSPEELRMKPVSGEVQLSFDVNQNGEPVNIQVVKSLCEKCDEEAVRLLKEGPKWKKKKNKKGKLTIHF
jgi:TonB family protein